MNKKRWFDSLSLEDRLKVQRFYMILLIIGDNYETKDKR